LAENPTQPEWVRCGLPHAWAQRSAWTVLDADFQDGQRFQRIWLAWQRDPQRSQMLHYVGIAATATILSPATGPAEAESYPNGWLHLVERSVGLGPGFHRIILDHARVSLTLCIGDVKAMLGEQVFHADTVFVDTLHDKWAVGLLARRCRRGSRFWMRTPAPAAGLAPSPANVHALLQAAGFQLDHDAPAGDGLSGSFNPPWNIPNSRTPSRHVVPAPARCAIIGAGIAGASVAHALAVRGWEVSVLDQEVRPAGGASSLPAGLAVPHVSADDNPRSRLSRSGSRLLAQHAHQMLAQGQDWDPSGVVEHRPDGSTLWHAQACWIRPDKLVQAWLSHPAIRFVGQARVAALRRTNARWQALGPEGHDLGSFDIVVVANAMGCAHLPNALPPDAQLAPAARDTLASLQAVHGTLSHGTYAEPIPGLPATPVNGHGCFIPHVPGDGGEHWFAGSTFETDAMAAADTSTQHTANMARLRQLLPMDGFDLAETLDRGPVTQWTATRCVTHDRLPLVGPIDVACGPGLWLCVGMGARGLSLSSLCAELLVARLGAEPLPIEFSLSRSLDINRPSRRPSLTLEE